VIVRDDIVERVAEGSPRAITQRSLQRRFQKVMGITPKCLAQVDRAHRAVNLLRTGRAVAAVADVAFALGFADQAHLTRSLKQWIGKTPGAIARELP